MRASDRVATLAPAAWFETFPENWRILGFEVRATLASVSGRGSSAPHPTGNVVAVV